MLFGDPSGIFGNERGGIAKKITKEIKKELISNPDIVFVPSKKNLAQTIIFMAVLPATTPQHQQVSASVIKREKNTQKALPLMLSIS